MSVLNITKDNFEKTITDNKTVLLDFYADWCGTCQMVSPIVKEIAAERTDIAVGKINVDNEPELAAAFKVMSIPMLAVIKDGKLANTLVGYRPKEEIVSIID